MSRAANPRPQGTRALQVVAAAGIAVTVHSFEAATTGNYGQQAASALGVDPDRLLKTLIVDTTAGKGPRRQLAVCALPVSFHLSLKKAAGALAVPKVTMATPYDAEKSSGYVTGGISPLGQKTPLPTLIDETAQLWDTVFVSAGKRGLDIELAPAELAHLIGARFVDLLAE